jgi:hypothetical protein
MRSFQFFDLVQYLGGRKQPQPKALAPAKIVLVEGDNDSTAAGNSRFQDPIVIRVTQERAPGVVDFMSNRHAADVVEDIYDIAAADRPISEIANLVWSKAEQSNSRLASAVLACAGLDKAQRTALLTFCTGS